MMDASLTPEDASGGGVCGVLWPSSAVCLLINRSETTKITIGVLQGWAARVGVAAQPLNGGQLRQFCLILLLRWRRLQQLPARGRDHRDELSQREAVRRCRAAAGLCGADSFRQDGGEPPACAGSARRHGSVKLRRVHDDAGLRQHVSQDGAFRPKAAAAGRGSREEDAAPEVPRAGGRKRLLRVGEHLQQLLTAAGRRQRHPLQGGLQAAA
mmetsp:Transcript_39273/g.100337  ORF Transcript_39273/g.100337 Transcript_39273/m.100337 type:complete len:212 (-) Transcript_39273:239-874(-)